MLFNEIIGNEVAKARLLKTVQESRVSHAQLFLGPEGSGKLQLALAYAQYINCNNRSETDSCGVCPSCIKYQKLIHPDLHFVFPSAAVGDTKALSKNFINKWREYLLGSHLHASFNDWINFLGVERKQAIINKDDCNEIIRTLSYKQYEAEYKVMIIWMTEKLFHASAPKLLKILEEPPEKTLFILIAEDQDQILSTILSRAQLFKVNKLTDEEMVTALGQRYQVEQQVMRRAVNMADGNYIAGERCLNQMEDQRQYFGLFSNWMRACYLNNIVKINEHMGEFAQMSRENQKAFLNYGISILRECFLLHYDNGALHRLDEEEQTFVKKFSVFVTPNNIGAFSKAINDAVSHVERNANANILFVDVSMKAHQFLKSAAAAPGGVKK